ncbi:MAG: molybdenum cofactor guanylyltransferase [Fimbriimonas sp.]
MGIEAVILTGGGSRRMGRDKATLPIDGKAQAQRIVDSLRAEGIAVTTLGREPTPGAAFIADQEEFAGPIAALSCFEPREDKVFVGSCDLPRFDPRLVRLLAECFEGDACVPVSDGFRQPLCALYASLAFGELQAMTEEGLRCPTKWLDRLKVRLVLEEELIRLGGNPDWTRGANTPEELARLIEC